MAQYSALTADQQSQLDAFLLTLRPLAGQGARYLFGANALLLDWANYADALVTQLDAGAFVPNKTGLAGAQPLAKEDIESLVSDLQSILTSYGTLPKQQLQAKACGAANLISG